MSEFTRNEKLIYLQQFDGENLNETNVIFVEDQSEDYAVVADELSRETISVLTTSLIRR
jgi:hypothetical protein